MKSTPPPPPPPPPKTPPPPPPPEDSASSASTEIAGQPPASAGKNAGKKPWSKPAILLIEEGVLLTDSSPDPFPAENHLYYMTS